MRSGVKWTIAIASVPARRELRQRILDQLDEQVAKYSDIEILVLEDNRKRILGDKRNALVDIAQGEYINFVDDDDLISDHYIDTIYPLLDGVDCVGIRAHISIEGGAWANVFYSKDLEIRNHGGEYFRPTQHLTPVRTDIVRQIPYRGHRYEDSNWSQDAKNSGLLRSENITDEVVYYYYATRVNNRVGVWK